MLIINNDMSEEKKTKISQKFYEKDLILLVKAFLGWMPKMIRNGELVYFFDGRRYKVFDKQEKRDRFYDFCVENGYTSLFTRKRKDDVGDTVMADREHVAVVPVDHYKNLINLKNGVLNLDTMELMPHSDKYYFTSCINIDYNPEAPKPELFIKTLQQIFADDEGNVDAESCSAITQIGGYLLYPGNNMKKMFIFLGEGANGKSILLDLYSQLFDKQTITSLSLAILSENTFKRSGILKAKANICTEDKSQKVHTEELKKIISGEQTNQELKFGDNIEFIPNIKLILSANNQPYFTDSTHAMRRRLFLLFFPNRFVKPEEMWKEKSKVRVRKASDDQILLAQLKEEMPGIINLFLDGLKMLIANNFVIKEPESGKEFREEFHASNDTAGTFLQEFYEITNTEFDSTPINYIMEDYRNWYRENVSERSLNYSTASLAKKIKEVFRFPKDMGMVRKYIDKVQYRAYLIKRKPLYEQELQQFADPFAGVSDSDPASEERQTLLLESFVEGK